MCPICIQKDWVEDRDRRERANSVLFCYDCGLEYGSSSWADVVVSNDVWKRISPTGDGGGLLCFNCMVRRLEELGLRDVFCKITSGPFATERMSESEPIKCQIEQLKSETADLRFALSVHSGKRSSFDLSDEEKQSLVRGLRLVGVGRKE